MKPRMEPQRLKETKWHEYLIRFVFGGLITALTGYLANRYGPGVGGLFLAFPAILPASATLIEKHSGEKAAGVDAAGALYGTIGLAVFGAIVWMLGPKWTYQAVLALASVMWFIVGTGLWWLRQARKHAESAVRRHERDNARHPEGGTSHA